jgi:hypothetical protein
MLTEDYLIRRISQVLALLLHAIGLRKDGQIVAAMTDVEIALELLLGMRADLLKQMDDPNLLQLLTIRGDLDLERLALVIDLYTEEAKLYEAQGQAAACFQDYLRALNFSLELALHDKEGISDERMARIAGLVGWFKERRLPLDTQALLLEYDQNLLELSLERLAAAGLERGAIETELEGLIRGFSQL